VDVVNSVHFSNHTGYAEGFEGDILKGEQLRAVLGGLERNGLLSDVGHLLTGYIGSDPFSAVLVFDDSPKREISSLCMRSCIGRQGKVLRTGRAGSVVPR
jgi:hypothetical protein